MAPPVSAQEAAAAIAATLGPRRARIAIVLGSGLGALAERVEAAVRIPYARIPGFPSPSVAGHLGELACGALGGTTVLMQSGRFHVYEGWDAGVVAFPIRTFATLGIGTIIFTNAAGGIRRGFGKGTLMLIADHLNLGFRNPLWGPVRGGEERFPDMSAPYDCELREAAREVARERRIGLAEGVYAGVLGPSYETPAEIRMLERLGADAVGMSTVAEVIAARADGLRCLGISTITNLAAGLSNEPLAHREVTLVASRVQGELAGLVEGIVQKVSSKR